jgi:hypothetical protein
MQAPVPETLAMPIIPKIVLAFLHDIDRYC